MSLLIVAFFKYKFKMSIYRVGQKSGTILLSNLNRFKKLFTGIFVGKFAVKRY